ncbi:alpha-1,3-arabinosyltransferase XAT3-like [Primulina huaijiensis]|uniref:alpha-1,3-arabinosyltransferase XAT3-like n=1 Tax=Primulina huaijiensis TaxID=1492673 RepID=UPI003CC75B72
MNDQVIAKGLTLYYNCKRLRCLSCAILFMLTIGICSTFRLHLLPSTSFGNLGVNVPLPTNATHETSEPTEFPEVETKTPPEPICRILKADADADYCEMEGDIRIEGNSSTIFFATSTQKIAGNSTISWSIQPYPRRGIEGVKKWNVKIVGINVNIPKCTENHKSPAVLFSTGGYSDNPYHAFADLILPLYTTSFDFKRDVLFLASDYQSSWLSKYHELLEKFTRHEIIDIDIQKQVHCYRKLVAGLNFEKHFIITRSGLSMSNFRRLIRETYSLERTQAMSTRNITSEGDNFTGSRPRIMIIKRKGTRILMNHGEVSRAASEVGFNVVLAEPERWKNLSRFARLVNSCDVLMGIHGAGLANMIFLPENAVVIQVVPFGSLRWLAGATFGNPSVYMKLKYLEYEIGENESSLSSKYSSEDPVLKDPSSIIRRGWDEMSSIYLQNQNVTIDIGRFENTLVQALELLSH